MTATIETTISGADVPKPTIVMPMIMIETPSNRAMAAAPSTNLSALQISKASPVMMAAMWLSELNMRFVGSSEFVGGGKQADA